MQQTYQTHCLTNGLRMIHLPSQSAVSYCGLAINAGSRDEGDEVHGLAHFVEHMLFKGTIKRKAWHILNRMENVGGELNAYTSKEETFLYTIFLSKDMERAIELLADISINSQFPPKEVKKEKTVILDEINSYEDSPSELIFDDFENILFDGHPIGHHILGNKRSLRSLNSQKGKDFLNTYYTAQNMVLFTMSHLPAEKIWKKAEKYFENLPQQQMLSSRTKPSIIAASEIIEKRKTYQSHIIVGSRAYDMHDERRVPLFLLNNILGGPGMNNRLNVSLREKRGIAYNIESNLSTYSDCGLFYIYLGTDKKNREYAIKLVKDELNMLRDKALNAYQLNQAKKQLIGQLGVGSDHNENLFLGLGKSFLHYNRYNSLSETFTDIESVTSEQLLQIANEIFDPKQLFTLIYE